MADIITNFLVYLTILSQILLVIFLAVSLKNKKYHNVLRKNYLILGFIVSLVATLGSLYFSDILGYTPCKLCWYQRILMYPQVLFFGIALFKKDHSILNYVLPLSVIGFFVAGFHYFLQIFPREIVNCNVVGYSSSCSDAFFTHLGYVTIPMMSLTAFALLILFSFIQLKGGKK